MVKNEKTGDLENESPKDETHDQPESPDANSRLEESILESGDSIEMDAEKAEDDASGQQADDEASLPTEPDFVDHDVPPIMAGPESGGKGLSGLALALSLAALAGTGYTWYSAQGLKSVDDSAQEPALAVDFTPQIDALQQKLQSLGESQETLSAMTDKQLARITEELAAATAGQVSPAAGKTDAEDTQASASPAQEPGTQAGTVAAASPANTDAAQQALQAFDKAMATANTRLGLSEAAQLLSIGEQQLTLASDVSAASTAFGLAKNRLAGLADSQVEPVIASISTSIEALDKITPVDKAGLTAQLAGLSASVDSLAFKSSGSLLDQPVENSSSTDESTAAADASAEASSDGDLTSLEGMGNWLAAFGSKVGNTLGDVGSGIADDLKGMVRIEKTGPMTDIVLGTGEQYFIRENIKLMLGSAQRAVLQGDTAVYQQSLAQAQQPLDAFFDGNDAQVKAMKASMEKLASASLEMEVPDISGASKLLSALMDKLASTANTQQN